MFKHYQIFAGIAIIGGNAAQEPLIIRIFAELDGFRDGVLPLAKL
jgi:hypothetical protein